MTDATIRRELKRKHRVDNEDVKMAMRHYGKIKKAKAAGKSICVGGIDLTMSVMGLRGMNPVSVCLNIISFSKTKKHLKALRDIKEADYYECECRNSECESVIGYAIVKKGLKMRRRAFALVPVAGSGASVESLVKMIYKRITGKRGVNRRKFATMLEESANNGCPMAHVIIEELLSYRTTYRKLTRARKTRQAIEDMIFDKLKST